MVSKSTAFYLVMYVALCYTTAIPDSICLKLDGLWVRDPTNCSVVYHCGKYGVVAQSLSCNKSQIWSTMANACVQEMDPLRDDCNLVLPVRIKDDPRCVIANGNNPDPDDCSAFLSCSNGTMVARQFCGEKTLYYARNDSCEFAYVAAPLCNEGTIPSHIVIEKASDICGGDYMDKGVRSPDDPCAFVHCYQGRVRKTEKCPFYTQFFEEKGSCDWSDAPECRPTMWRIPKSRTWRTEQMFRTTTPAYRWRRTTTRKRRKITWGRPSWVKRGKF